MADDRGGSGADLVRYRIDGADAQAASTSEGTATLSVAEGRHRLDYRGRDRAGNEPSAFESRDVIVDRTDPNVAVTSDQNRVSYRVGASGSASVRASDEISGLAEDPSGQVSLDTTSPGVRTITRTARDRCGNETTRSFSYEVVLAPRVGLTGVRSSACRTRDFSARVRVRSAKATRTRVFLDGRQVRTTQRKTFRVRIPASRMSSRRHRVSVVTVDTAGNRTVRQASFVRCPRALRFTG